MKEEPYCRKKATKISKVLKEKILHIPAEEPVPENDGCDVILQQLKEKFEETTMKSENFDPSSWTLE